MSESNRVRLAYKPAGAPVTAWQTLRRTNDTLTIGTETVVSDEVRSDRKRGGQKIVTQTAGGTVDFEFSARDYDDLLAAAFMTTWTADKLEVGTTTVEIDILKSYLDENRHVLIEKAQISDLTLTMDSGAKITGQITVAGTTINSNYTISTDSFAAPGAELMMDSSNNLGSIQLNGAPLSGMCFTSMSFALSNNHTSDQCLGSVTQNHFKGSAAITGSITVRSSAAAFDLWQNSITNTPVKLEYVLSDGGDSYAVAIESAYLSGDLPSGGLDAILSFDLSYTAAAKADGSYASITRTLTP
jgi:hypothetical protein